MLWNHQLRLTRI
jgi:phosphatidylinositol glycan class F